MPKDLTKLNMVQPETDTHHTIVEILSEIRLEEVQSSVKSFRFESKHMDDVTDIEISTGFCTSDGKWGIEGYIDHQSWWPASYKIGITFGRKDDGVHIPLTETYWSEAITHSNGARLHHEVVGIDSSFLKSNFHAITDAQRRVSRIKI